MIGDIHADIALPDLVAKLYNGVAQSLGSFLFLFQQMQYQAKGGFPSDARQAGEFRNRRFKQF